MVSKTIHPWEIHFHKIYEISIKALGIGEISQIKLFKIFPIPYGLGNNRFGIEVGISKTSTKEKPCETDYIK